MERDYLQEALQTFNDTNGVNWYGWKKEDSSGNKIPDSDRMQYQHIKIIKEGASMPSEAQVNAKIQEIKDADLQVKTDKSSGKAKLKELGLTDAEVSALIGE
tara:strand:+ start:632 stop:937 length:306 start_codon:yes stop_codon:yes gene_type:complete